MPFLTGHKQFNTGRTYFKKGEHVSPSTEFKSGEKSIGHIFKKGCASPMKGKHHSDETKRLLRLSITPEMRENIRQRMLGNKLNLGKKYSQERVKKISKAFQGEKSHFWKGGVTSKHEIIRHSSIYSQWRKAVFERDNYTCVLCKDNNGGNLQADHIKRFSEFPELRFDINNGRTLCKRCHELTDTYGNKQKYKEVRG